MFELLLGKGIVGNIKAKETITKHKTRLNGEFIKLKVRRGAKKNEDLIPEKIRNAGFLYSAFKPLLTVQSSCRNTFVLI